MTASPVTAEKLHPFEAAGMGRGPFTFVGVHDIAEAREHAMRHLGGTHNAGHPVLKGGLGTCSCCGMGINVVCIIRDADGDQWGVGSDCAEKTDDPSIGDNVRIAVARRRRQREAARRAERQAAKEAAWAARPSPAPDALPGETNGAYRDRHTALRVAAHQVQLAKEAKRLEDFSEELATLKAIAGEGNSFAEAMRQSLQNGPLTERQADCTAKFFHRRGTQAHHDLVTRFMS